MEDVKIELITSSDDAAVVKFLGDMLCQLMGREEELGRGDLERIINGGSEIYVLRCSGELAGMVTLSVLKLSSGVRGCIDDVVVSERFRGRGFGRLLIEFIEKRAMEVGVESLFLTSSPNRVSANELYCKMNFVKKETNVYIKRLN